MRHVLRSGRPSSALRPPWHLPSGECPYAAAARPLGTPQREPSGARLVALRFDSLGYGLTASVAGVSGRLSERAYCENGGARGWRGEGGVCISAALRSSRGTKVTTTSKCASPSEGRLSEAPSNGSGVWRTASSSGSYIPSVQKSAAAFAANGQRTMTARIRRQENFLTTGRIIVQAARCGPAFVCLIGSCARSDAGSVDAQLGHPGVKLLPAHLQQARRLRLVPARNDQGTRAEHPLQLPHRLLHRHREQLGEARLTPGARGAAGERRQVLQRDQRPTGEDDGAVDQILQLADVPGIVVQEQGSHGLVSEA